MLATIAMAATLLGGPSYGVGTNSPPVCLHQASPGNSYDLGKIYIQNTGTATEVVDFWPMSFDGKPVPWASWLSESDPGSLGHGQGADVDVHLNIPSGASTGSYGGYLNATPAAPDSPGIHLAGGSSVIIRFGVGVQGCTGTIPSPPAMPTGLPTAGITPGVNIPGGDVQQGGHPQSQQQPGIVQPSPSKAANSPFGWVIAVAVAILVILGVTRLMLGNAPGKRHR